MTRFAIPERALNWRLAAFLVLCLILGGTSQDIAAMKLPLYLSSLIMIAATLTSKQRAPLSNLFGIVESFGAALLILYFAYLIPLPPSIWTELDGREMVATGFNSIGADLPWLPLSLSPEKTFRSTFDFLPLVAILLIFRLQASSREKKNTILMLIFVAVLSVLLGIFQFLGIESLYLYKITNEGLPVGFFSNANHQSCFLAMALPFAILLGFKPRRLVSRRHDVTSTAKILGVFASILIIIGILLTNSLAGYIFLLITVLPALLIGIQQRGMSKYILAIAGVLIAALILDFTIFGSHITEFASEFSDSNAISRAEMFSVTTEAQKHFGLFGSGPGSFIEVYYGQENRDTMRRIFVNEAHNDYLQSWLELGIFGAILIAGFLLWYIISIGKLVFSSESKKALKTLVILSIACPIIHSVVDYSLRTMAISSVFWLMLLMLRETSSEPKKAA